MSQDYDSKNEPNPQGKNPSLFDLSKQMHFDQIDSTNTWAKSHWGEWADQGVTLVTASTQTAGRGRFDRRWISPPDLNIYATYCFWMDEKRKDMGQIPQLLALASVIELEDDGFNPKIKWPNDLLIGKKKLGGILCETILEGGKRGVICGLGLNVNMPQELLIPLLRPATSLFVEKGTKCDREQLLKGVSLRFVDYLNRFMQEGFSPFFSSFREKFLFRRGDTVCFHIQQDLLEARFEELHEDGSVELLLKEGTRRRIYSGELIEADGHLRS